MSVLRLTVLGSGTSVGVPTIGCHCNVCTSEDPRDQRLRPSVMMQFNGRTVLVDTTPDFRQQALRYRIERLDAILFTHAHADHIMGLDDVRPYNFRQRGPIPIYGSEATIQSIQRVFSYIFQTGHSESSIPKLEPHIIDERPFPLFGLECIPVPVAHGSGRVLGFRIGPLAYLTDHSDIPEESLQLLEGLDVLFLDALRHKPHPTHSTIEKSLSHVERLKPRRAFFTHISHDLPHARTGTLLPDPVCLAYDGMVVDVEIPDPAPEAGQEGN